MTLDHMSPYAVAGEFLIPGECIADTALARV